MWPFKRKKKQVKGYLTLILNTGYEVIPNVRCIISKYKQDIEDDNSYWYKNKVQRVIELYDKEIDYLNSRGYYLDKWIFKRRLGYDDVLELSDKKIIKLIPTNKK